MVCFIVTSTDPRYPVTIHLLTEDEPFRVMGFIAERRGITEGPEDRERPGEFLFPIRRGADARWAMEVQYGDNILTEWHRIPDDVPRTLLDTCAYALMS
jgi:hypothetical protein